tara:strand:+ start:734 stop:1117 length:384 start_codon:yes stop_codon:yes gene_type:complete
MSISIPVSIGELWDKYTILLIKQEKIKNKEKIKYINSEIDYLNNIMKDFSYSNNMDFIELKKINESLWNIEDQLRIKEQKKEFDDEFINLARNVYFTNDKRAELKRKINENNNSPIIEIKDYVNYQK